MAKRSRDEDDSSSHSRESASQTASSPAKIIELARDDSADIANTMQCLLPPHQALDFPSAEAFDVHYAKEHTNRCSACSKNFPSAHYLTLHIDENHNPVREALAAKGEKTYGCFLEDCDKKCSTPQKRRLHLIDKHMFPKVYDFRIIDHGIDRSHSLLQGGQRRKLSTNGSIGCRRQASVVVSTIAEAQHGPATPEMLSQQGTSISQSKQQAETDEHSAIEVDELEKMLTALKFVPPSVQARARNKKPN